MTTGSPALLHSHVNIETHSRSEQLILSFSSNSGHVDKPFILNPSDFFFFSSFFCVNDFHRDCGLLTCSKQKSFDEIEKELVFGGIRRSEISRVLS